ncbi:MAG: alginate lyase family protein [Chloroflexi bacterium]|nr:alginate lyase family protein [Chloroflexota bacterium]
MLNKFRALFSLYKRFGLRWLLFRAGYALRMRLGILRAQFPVYEWDDRPLKSWFKPDVPSDPEQYLAWRNEHAPKFFFDGIPSLPSDPAWNPQLAVDEAEKILAGELRYFEHTPYPIGFPPDWHLDPRTNIRVDATKHWSQIPDYGAYDIKFIWEASRFSQVYTLMRAYAFNRDERYPQAFWTLVEDWARTNPPQRGPNWKCGQETSLRLLAWTFGLYAFADAPSSTPTRRARLTQLVAAQAERVHRNIDFAVSTRGNHAMSESFGIWLAGTLFPELEHAETYRALGREILEREAATHIFADGAYSMYSLNYHRFILHVYFLALRLGELNNARFSDALYQSISRSLDFFAQLIQPESGEMPVYGSNDGALVCPLDSCDFTDYRPTLQMGWVLIHGERLFDAGAWDESIFWLWGGRMNSPQRLRSRPSSPGQSAKVGFAGVGVREASNRPTFPDGGLHILRGQSSAAFIRCADYRERPSHADQLHVDLWMRGQNIAVDAGTFLYNGQGLWQNGLARTSVHNTVTVDSADQMLWFSRFTWGEWARGRVLKHDEHYWQGEHNGYARFGVQHTRSVLSLEDDRWLILDHLVGNRPHRFSLQWLLNDLPHSVRPEQNLISLSSETDKFQIRMGLLEGQSKFSLVRGDEGSTRGWRSRYYGQKEPALSAMLETERAEAVFWTFFGFEGDTVTLSGAGLDLAIGRRAMRISLNDLTIKDG